MQTNGYTLTPEPERPEAGPQLHVIRHNGERLSRHVRRNEAKATLRQLRGAR